MIENKIPLGVERLQKENDQLRYELIAKDMLLIRYSGEKRKLLEMYMRLRAEVETMSRHPVELVSEWAKKIIAGVE